jgi:hypothetical protein
MNGQISPQVAQVLPQLAAYAEQLMHSLKLFLPTENTIFLSAESETTLRNLRKQPQPNLS